MTDSINDSGILTSEIKDLPVSECFYLRCKLMGFTNIEQIVSTPPAVIVQMEEFNYSWLGELVRLLTSYNMLHRLQRLPGSSFY